jgi:hypothetical protein
MAEQDLLGSCSDLKRDGSLRGGEHVPELGEFVWLEPTHELPDPAFHHPKVRSVRDRVLHQAQAVLRAGEHLRRVCAQGLDGDFLLATGDIARNAGALRLLPPGRNEGLLGLGQHAGAEGGTRSRRARLGVIVRDQESECPRPLNGLEHTEVLGFGAEQGSGSLRGGTRETRQVSFAVC